MITFTFITFTVLAICIWKINKVSKQKGESFNPFLVSTLWLTAYFMSFIYSVILSISYILVSISYILAYLP